MDIQQEVPAPRQATTHILYSRTITEQQLARHEKNIRIANRWVTRNRRTLIFIATGLGVVAYSLLLINIGMAIA